MNSSSKTVLVTGASGFVGSRLCELLQKAGYLVRGLSRSAERYKDSSVRYFGWNPATGELDSAALENCDAIIHLAGESVVEGFWTAKRKQAILESRTRSTKLLVDAIKDKDIKFISASAIGYYGAASGEELKLEDAALGEGFLAEVVRDWEAEIFKASEQNAPAAIRVGLVLDPSGGLLQKILPIFRFALGGRLGDGKHWMSWISLEDLCRAFLFLLENPEKTGVFNGTAPAPLTNNEFTKALGKALSRPTLFPVPSFGPKLIFGAEMCREIFFSSVRAEPKALLDAGFEFKHKELSSAFASML